MPRPPGHEYPTRVAVAHLQSLKLGPPKNLNILIIIRSNIVGHVSNCGDSARIHGS